MKDELLSEIKWYEDRLLHLSNKLFFIEEAEEQFNSRFDKEFTVQNDILWTLYNDSIDMLIIDLTSISKKLYSKHGLLSHLVNYKNLLKVMGKSKITPPKSIDFSTASESEIEITKKMNDAYVKNEQKALREKLIWLFPSFGSTNKVSNQDIEELKSRVFEAGEKVFFYRNSHSAHKYDKDNRKAESSSILFSEIRDFIRFLQELLNSIKLIISRTTLAYVDCNYKNSYTAAIEIVNLITTDEIE